MRQFTWKPKHTQILLLVSKGESTADVAKKMGFTSPRYVNELKARPEFQEKLAKLNVQVDKRLVEEGVKHIADEIFLKDAARKELERASLHAARTITQLLSRRKKLDRNAVTEMRLKFEAAKDVLDRIGLKPREVVETIERNYTTEEIESALSTMKELSSMSQNQFVFGGQVKRIKSVVDATSPVLENLTAIAKAEEDAKGTFPTI